MRLFTIGHSTRTLDDFLSLLDGHGIRMLADIRRYPVSRRLPHFSGGALAASLAGEGIAYRHLPDLGGRRAPQKDSPNTAWRHAAFRGYADYMGTQGFVNAVEALRQEARAQPTVMMCAEALWWKCHRGLVADWFKAQGDEVLHILDAGPKGLQPHPWTAAARLVEGRLTYAGPAEETENLLL